MLLEGQVIAKQPLIRCEMCGRQFATPKFLKHVENSEKEKEHPDVKENHAYCPTCAKLYSKKSTRLTAPVFSKPLGYKSANEKGGIQENITN